MFQSIRTRLALGAAAVALLIGGLAGPIAPAFAATSAPAQEEVLATPKPDIRPIIFQIDHYGVDDEHFHVRFQIRNDGNAFSSGIAVKAECVNDAHPGSREHWIAMAQVVQGLPKNTTSNVMMFTCEDATGARLTVGTQNDSNTNNNTTEINWQG